MGSPERSIEGDGAESPESSDGAKVNWLRKKLALKVKQAMAGGVISGGENAKFNEKDAKEYMNWVNSENDLSKLKEADSGKLEKAVEFVRDLNQKYEKFLEEDANENLIRRDAIPGYMKWWRKLSDAKRIQYIRNRENKVPYSPETHTDLENPKRKILRNAMDPSRHPPGPVAENSAVRLPESVRKENWSKFTNLGLEERGKLVAKLAKEHVELKNAFLELPAEVQKKYLDQFTAANFDKRRALLKQIQKETGQEVLRKNEKPEKESVRLDTAYCEKADNMEQEELISKEGAREYKEWFKALSLEQKKVMLHHSELDSRRDPITGKNLREAVRDRFRALSPELQAKHRESFLSVDVDRRLQILEGLEHPEKTNDDEENAVEYTPEQITAAIEEVKLDPNVQESLMVASLIELKLEQHKRAREKLGVAATAKADEVMQKADEKGMKKHEVDVGVRKTMAIHDKRASVHNSKNAFSAVERMRQERIKQAQEFEHQGVSESEELADKDSEEIKESFEQKTGEELVEDLQHVGELDEKTKEQAQNTQFEDVHVNTLKHSREARQAQRKAVVENQEGFNNEQVRRADFRFFNKEGTKELSEHEFRQQEEPNIIQENRARFMPLLKQKLPGASTKVLAAALEAPNAVRVDFRKVTG